MEIQIEEASAAALIEWASQTHGRRFAVVTSFQSEGMVVLDLAYRADPAVRVITLDTGRLPAATYDMMEMVRQRYRIDIETVMPEALEAGRMVTRFGPNLFYESLAHRRLCCEVRKVRPLAKKLEGIDAYAVGLRRSQGVSREGVEKVAHENGKLKISPLAGWTSQQVRDYTREHDLPVHPLYSAGYTSIGCEPCTRAVRSGESERAGRWWWEQDGNAECGLHFSATGKVERSVDVLLREILTD